MVLLAGVGSVLAEVVAGRSSSAVVVRLGLVVATLGFATLLVAPAFGVFVAGLAAYGIGLGLVDASSNMQAVTVEHLYRRPILPSFHAFWTAGGIVATLITLATSGVAIGPALLPLLVLPVAALAAPFVTRDRVPAAGEPLDVPWRKIVLLGLAMVLFYMVDTAATTWGPVYLDGTLDAPTGLAALATLPYLVATLLARGIGDGLVHRYGAVWLLRICGVVAAVALAVIVFAPTWVVAVIGFTVLGGAVATIAPLSFSAAGAIAGGEGLENDERHIERVDQVVARFNQFNYVGALLGAVLTGAVGSENLRLGFAVPMVLILGIVPLAKSAFRAGRRASRIRWRGHDPPHPTDLSTADEARGIRHGRRPRRSVRRMDRPTLADALRHREAVIRAFFDADGRLASIPTKIAKRLVVLDDHIAQDFEMARPTPSRTSTRFCAATTTTTPPCAATGRERVPRAPRRRVLARGRHGRRGVTGSVAGGEKVRSGCVEEPDQPGRRGVAVGHLDELAHLGPVHLADREVEPDPAEGAT